MSQLPLSLPSTPIYLEQNFIRSACNSEALDHILRWPDWPSYGLIIYGEEGSGKTHLGHIWTARSGASIEAISKPELDTHRLIDDIERYDETLLFHILNIAREKKLSLLLTASKPASLLHFTLPDLTSRLKALPAVAIHAPDDDLLSALLRKQFSDRQLMVDDEVITYITARMERGFRAASRLVEHIDRIALSQHRRITIPLAKQVMEATD